MAFETVTGTTPPKSKRDLYGNFIPFVKPPELRNEQFDSSEDSLSKAGAAVARVLPTKSILVSCIGNLGKVGLNTVPVAFNQQINAIIPNEGNAMPEFMFYQALSDSFRDQLEAAASGTTIRIVNKTKFNSVEIVLPPLNEQKRIVAILDQALEAIDTAARNTSKNLDHAQELFDSYLGGIFARTDNGWVAGKLSSFCRDITVGHVGSMAKRYVDIGVPFLRSQNIRPFEVSLENVVYIDEKFDAALTKSKLEPGDVAIVRTGYPGTAAVIPESLARANCADLVIVRPGPALNPHFLAAFFNSPYGKSLVGGKLVGAAQKHFNVKSAKEATLNVPPIAEQNEIVNRIDVLRREADRLATIYRKKAGIFDNLRQSTLSQAFSDKLPLCP
jgi:type I restriction enzyme S subunit